MDVGEHARDAAVHLLRPGVVLVERAQARLDVPDLAAVVEGGEAPAIVVVVSPCTSTQSGRSCSSTGRRPSMHRRPSRRFSDCAVLHHVEVVIGLDPEEVEHLVEHLPVLAGDADA